MHKYNDITTQDIEKFNKREILFRSTFASNLQTENAILTLVNIQNFEEKKHAFFKRLKNSKKIMEYSQERKYTLFYKFLINYLTENESKHKEVQYIAENILLSNLKEAAILMYDEAIEEE